MSAFSDPKRWLEMPEVHVESAGYMVHKAFAKETSQTPPLDTLPSDIFLYVMGYLDLDTIVKAQRVNSGWRNTIVSDQLGWKERCDRLWADKGETMMGEGWQEQGRPYNIHIISHPPRPQSTSRKD